MEPDLAPSSRRIDLAGPAGRLEALLEPPVGEPAGAGVVCHPHPLHGGTMHNKVVYQAAKGLVAARMAALRFNFRGVGRSEGVHDAGRGECQDVGAALDLLEDRFGPVPVVAAGFSFGAMVGLRTARSRPEVAGLIAMGLPLAHDSFDFLRSETRPLLVLQGENDLYGPVSDVHALVAGLGPAVQFRVIPGVDHFFTGKVDTVREIVTEFCAGIVSLPGPVS